MIRSNLTASSLESTRRNPCTTCWRICRRCGEFGFFLRKVALKEQFLKTRIARRQLVFVASAVMLVAFQHASRAQSADGHAADRPLDSATLLKPPADSWPMYHGNYSGQHHSKLAQI